MNSVRPAAVAGSFYPGTEPDLRLSVDQLLANARAGTDSKVHSSKTSVPKANVPKAIIAPHAGYIYSGSVAASVYGRLLNAGKLISKVILMGPSHQVAFNGIAAPSCGFYTTPLGDIPLLTTMIESILELPGVAYLDEAHLREHSLEVHLPFLQRTLADFSLLPLVVGESPPEQVSRVLEYLWGGDETLIIISSDLSHYHEYNDARRLDEGTSLKIQQLSYNIKDDEACGCRPINGLLHFAKQKGYRLEEVDLRNSGDTSGGRDRVVGYGAFVLTTSPD